MAKSIVVLLVYAGLVTLSDFDSYLLVQNSHGAKVIWQLQPSRR
jgi:hypothetical protein